MKAYELRFKSFVKQIIICSYNCLFQFFSISILYNIPSGLSEVVGGLGIQKLQSLMPDIIQTAGRTDITPNVRDGYIMMYIYLPAVFGDDFIPYVGPIIPSILKVRITRCSTFYCSICFFPLGSGKLSSKWSRVNTQMRTSLPFPFTHSSLPLMDNSLCSQNLPGPDTISPLTLCEC